MTRPAYLIIIFILGLSLVATAQDIHHQQAKPVEELLYRKDPTKARSMFTKDKFLVLEKVRSGKRARFYKGDVFRFKTKEGISYEDDLFEVRDSSFVITTFNEVTNRYEYVEVNLSDVKRIYKYPKRRITFGLANFSPFSYVLIEWVAWNVNPVTNPKLILAAGLTAASPLLTVIKNNVRSKKITENYRLRVFQSF